MKSFSKNLKSSVRSSSRRRRAAAVQPVFETLEERQLMSALTIAPNTGSDSITLDVAGNGGIIAIVDGNQTTYSPGQFTSVQVTTFQDTEEVTVRATTVPVNITANQAALVTVASLHGVQNVHAPISVNTAFGFYSTVRIDDSGDATGRTATLDVNGANEVVTGMAPASISFNSSATSALFLTTGGGADNLSIKDTSANTTVEVNNNGGSDNVTIGGSPVGSWGINGPVIVRNTPDFTHLVVDDTNDSARNITLDNGGFGMDTITGASPATISYKALDVTDVVLKTPQSGGNSIYVNSIDRLTSIIGNAPTNNDDYVEVGGTSGNMSGITASLSLSNPSGYDRIQLNDSQDTSPHTIVVNSQSESGMSLGSVSWANSDTSSVEVDPPNIGGNTILVQNTGVATEIHSNSFATDNVTVSDNGSVQGIAGPLTITNTVGYSTLTIDDSSDAIGRSATLQVGAPDPGSQHPYGVIAGLAPATIRYRANDIAGPVVIQGGGGGNAFTIQGTPLRNLLNPSIGGPTINLNTGGGSDVTNVQGLATNTTLNIEGQIGLDTVNINGAGTVQNVLGTVNVTNSLGVTQLNITDSLDVTPRTISFDTFTPAGSITPWGTITGLAPGVINYRADDMRDPLVVHAGSGGNTITVNNTPTKFTGGNTGNTINLFSGTGLDHVTVKAIGPGTTLNIEGEAQYDTVLIGDNGSVQNIRGTVTVRDTNSFTHLTVDDSADAASRIVTLGAQNGIGDTESLGTITGLAPGVIKFEAADVSAPVIDGGSGDNVYTVTAMPTFMDGGFGGPEIDLNAGDGNDIINVQSMASATHLLINGQGGDDALSVDFSAGQILPYATVNFDGGPQAAVGDSLSIHGTVFTSFDMLGGQVSLGNINVSYSNTESLFCNSGVFNANADLGPINVVAQSPATTLHFNTSQNINKLVVSGGHANLAAGGKSLAVTGLTVDSGGQLDLSDGSLKLAYGANPDPIATIRSYINSGSNGGAWNGPGLTSSMADADHGLGYADSADGTVSNLGSQTILVKRARYGDVNLDGTVNFNDVLILIQNYGHSGQNWDQGELNYDGTINFSDVLKMIQNYGKA